MWFVIHSYGLKDLQVLIREHLRLAEPFKDWIVEDSRFELMAPVNFSLVCLRYRKEGAGEDEMSGLNSELMEKVNASGKVCLTHTTPSSSRFEQGRKLTSQPETTAPSAHLALYKSSEWLNAIEGRLINFSLLC